MDVFRQGREDRAEIEELVLHAQQDGAEQAAQLRSIVRRWPRARRPRNEFSSSTVP